MSRALFLLWLIPMLVLVTGCREESTSAEDEIRQYIDRGIAAAEDRSSSDLGEMIHPGFVNEKGMDKQQTVKLLRLYFFRHKNIHLFKKIESIVFHAAHQATVNLHVAMTGRAVTDSSMLLGLRARVYQFELQLVKEDEWLLNGASWRPSSIGQLQK